MQPSVYAGASTDSSGGRGNTATGRSTNPGGGANAACRADAHKRLAASVAQ